MASRTSTQTATATDTQTTADLSKRDRRALSEVISIIPPELDNNLEDDECLAVSESGSSYTVDIDDKSCECPDSLFNTPPEGRCKHVRRAEYATGERDVPMTTDVDVDPALGQHT